MKSIFIIFVSLFITNYIEINSAFNYVKDDRGIKDWKYHRVVNVDGENHLLYRDLDDDTMNSIQIKKETDEYVFTILYEVHYYDDDYVYEDYDILSIRKVNDEYKIRYLGE